MRWSRYFIPTLREDPADAEAISHKLLLRAGVVRQLSAGIYSYLPLGQRVALKIMQILREEMNAVGGQEFYLPALQPAEIWQQSGRWDAIGEEMFRLKDRKGMDMCLGMTHEEVLTTIARSEIRSYKQLPQVWYQIQIKFRDEARPKSGLMRLRSFIMKDAYTFDVDFAGLDKAFGHQRQAYKNIFTRCGLEFLIVEASSGSMGGTQSNEFIAPSEAGEDFIVSCPNCGYAANLEKASSRLPEITDEAGPDALEEFPTPGVRTIEDLISFPGGAEANRQIKSLVFIATIDGEQRPVLVLLRGDHQLHEIKLVDSLHATAVRPAHPDEIRDLLGASAGSLGGVGAKTKARDLRIVADTALKNRRNMTNGANKDDHHLRGVNIARDIPVDDWFDLRMVQSGEGCPKCDTGVLEIFKGMEIGHIFKLGTKYSETMGATVLTQEGKEVPIVMGSYGIGVERIISAVVEQQHDGDGIIWPKSLAPFDVVITITNMKQDELRDAGEKLYEELQRAGFEILLDDRDERAGVKFKDADLIGIPYRITIGKKVAEGLVELFNRRTKQSEDVKITDVVSALRRDLHD
jgi:prolyl-tRNA synthetase